MTKNKREQARELALKLNQVIIDSDVEISTGVLLAACAQLIGTATAAAGEVEDDVARDMAAFQGEVESAFRFCREHITKH
jgi:hypothetical protein